MTLFSPMFFIFNSNYADPENCQLMFISLLFIATSALINVQKYEHAGG